MSRFFGREGKKLSRAQLCILYFSLSIQIILPCQSAEYLTNAYLSLAKDLGLETVKMPVLFGSVSFLLRQTGSSCNSVYLFCIPNQWCQPSPCCYNYFSESAVHVRLRQLKKESKLHILSALITVMVDTTKLGSSNLPFFSPRGSSCK